MPPSIPHWPNASSIALFDGVLQRQPPLWRVSASVVAASALSRRSLGEGGGKVCASYA
jgi:hypothetical protein